MAENQRGISTTTDASGREIGGHRLGASYRDPSGFVFNHRGAILRQINRSYQQDYEKLIGSGLYTELVDAGLLVSHQDSDQTSLEPQNAWKVVEPRRLAFISYPYEWCFSQLKAAALATLDLQKRAMKRGMSLKDASAYNIQFENGKPILIDTLSFEQYRPDQPWPAYRQFCQHFLAPLALMDWCDVRLGQLLGSNLDGIPLDLASKLLPRSTWMRFSLAVHLHLHAKMQKWHGSDTQKPKSIGGMSRSRLTGILDSLEGAVAAMRWEPTGTQWANYAQGNHSYSEQAATQKRQLIQEFLDSVQPKSVWDLGANTGEYSRLASQRGIPTVAFDADPAAVEKNFLLVQRDKEQNLLPLVMDLTQPSAAIGWNNGERQTLAQRGPADLTLALALVHHLAISGNVPLGHLAQFLATISKNLAIEFVPKTDPQVDRLLVVRKDIFGDYTQENFEAEFGRFFEILRREPLADSQRTLFLMRRRET